MSDLKQFTTNFKQSVTVNHEGDPCKLSGTAQVYPESGVYQYSASIEVKNIITNRDSLITAKKYYQRISVCGFTIHSIEFIQAFMYRDNVEIPLLRLQLKYTKN